MGASSIGGYGFTGSSSLTRFSPEPRVSGAVKFGNIIKSAGSTLANSIGAATGINPEFAELIQLQIEAQKQMQLVSLVSNVEKSKHETNMVAIRNVKTA